MKTNLANAFRSTKQNMPIEEREKPEDYSSFQDCVDKMGMEHCKMVFGKETSEAFVKEPFADYDDFDDCVSKNQDKGDPQAFCASIKRQVEGP